MSSAIPTRRTTRTTRTAALKDNENANARPSRITTRAKPPSATAATTSTTGGLARATAPTAASRAKAGAGDAKADPSAGKRKREALSEVTSLVTNNKPRGTTTRPLKGKDKEAAPKEKFDGVVLKAKATTVPVREPLRTVSGPALRRPTRSTTVALQRQLKTETVDEPAPVDDIKDDNAMVISPPAIAQLRRSSTRRSTQTTSAIPTRQSDVLRRVSTRSVTISKPQPEEDAEISRVFKKRRTSSDAPEEAPVPSEDDRLHDESDAAAARIAAELEAFADTEHEADPEGDEWDDLDTEDAYDPLMVSEYVVEIFKYMRVIEQTTLPNPNYMDTQKELAWKMRAILTDWLVQVHLRFRLLPETLFLCVNIIDRFLSARVVSLAKLQLVGVTCMFIAAKFEEIVAPSVSHFLHCADSSYTEAEILQAERYVLKTLDWNLSYPNPVHFLRRVSKADDYDVRGRTVAKYLLEIGCLEWRLIATPPSLMAAAAIWLARLILGREQWTPNLAHYSSYSESELVPTANLMLNYILKPIRHESFHKKYAAKRFYKSSVHLRQWALDRWPENTQVALADELPALKASVRAEREAEEAAGAAISEAMYDGQES